MRSSQTPVVRVESGGPRAPWLRRIENSPAAAVIVSERQQVALQ